MTCPFNNRNHVAIFNASLDNNVSDFFTCWGRGGLWRCKELQPLLVLWPNEKAQKAASYNAPVIPHMLQLQVQAYHVWLATYWLSVHLQGCCIMRRTGVELHWGITQGIDFQGLNRHGWSVANPSGQLFSSHKCSTTPYALTNVFTWFFSIFINKNTHMIEPIRWLYQATALCLSMTCVMFTFLLVSCLSLTLSFSVALIVTVTVLFTSICLKSERKAYVLFSYWIQYTAWFLPRQRQDVQRWTISSDMQEGVDCLKHVTICIYHLCSFWMCSIYFIYSICHTINSP